MDRKAAWALLAVTLFGHFQLLLGDGLAWDSWLIERIAREGDWRELYAMYAESGLPPLAWTHRVIGSLPDTPLAYRWVTFAAIWATAFGLYRLLRRIDACTAFEALAVAALATAWPAYQAAGLAHIMTPYHTCYAAFFAGWALLVPVLLAPGGVAQGAWRCALAGVLLFYSFTINSLLVFHGGVWLCVLAVAWTRGIRPWRGAGPIAVVATTCALPPLFWIVKETQWPRHSAYSTYNQFASDSREIFLCGLTLGYIGIADALLAMARWLPLGAIGALAAGWWLRGREGERVSARRRALLWIAAGSVLLAAALAPYALTLRWPTGPVVNTRHLLLVAVPAAVGIVFALGALLGNRRAHVLGAVVAALVLCGSAVTVREEAALQLRWIRDRSVVAHVSAMEGARPFQAFVIVDRRSPIGSPFPHSFYEWSHLLHEALGPPGRLGIQRANWSGLYPLRDRKFHTRRYMLDGFDPEAPAARLVIADGAEPPGAAEVARYHALRIFGTEEELRAFLLGVCRVELLPPE